MPTSPRVVLHVALTNRSKDRLEFAVRDVISELGSFAIRPERFTLAPGETAEIDPLSSSFPMTISELTVELRVRRAGAMETQTVRLIRADTVETDPSR